VEAPRQAAPHAGGAVMYRGLRHVVALAGALLAVAFAAAAVEVHLVVVKDQSVIAGDPNRTVRFIENLSVNNNGQWLVEVTLNGDANDASTVLTGLNFGAPSVFLREGQALSSPPGASISSFDDFNINNNGNFGGNLFLRGLPSNQDSGVYFNNNVVIQESQLADVPPFEPNSPYIGFFGAQINDSDQIAIMASLDIPSVATTVDRAIVVVDNPGGVPTQTLIAKEGDELLPTRFVSDFGTGPHEWSLNNNGDLTYFADLTGDTANDGTVWKNSTLLAQEGSPAPVTGRDWLTLSSFANTQNNVGDYAFLGRMNGDLASDVILVKNGAKYLQEADPAPGLPGFFITGFFTVGGGPIRMNDNGDILHFLDWDDPDTTKDTGLFLGNTMLLQEGVSQIDGLPVRVINNGQDAFAMSASGEYVILECSVYYAAEDLVREAAALIRITPDFCLGDADCDGDVDFFDIDPFVSKLGCPGVDPVACSDGCPWQNADADEDGDVDFFDIDPFVALLGTTCP
jgi:hypothetical protein